MTVSILLFLMIVFSASSIAASCIHRLFAFTARDDVKKSGHRIQAKILFQTGIVVALCAMIVNIIWS